MAFDVVLESSKTFLPLVGLGVPCPAGQILEPPLTIGIELTRLSRVTILP